MKLTPQNTTYATEPCQWCGLMNTYPAETLHEGLCCGQCGAETYGKCETCGTVAPKGLVLVFCPWCYDPDSPGRPAVPADDVSLPRYGPNGQVVWLNKGEAR